MHPADSDSVGQATMTESKMWSTGRPWVSSNAPIAAQCTAHLTNAAKFLGDFTLPVLIKSQLLCQLS